MPHPHDSAYKDFFSHKQVVVDLLRGYVHQCWVDLLDFETLEKVNSSYVHESDEQRADDAVWRLKLKDRGDWVYLYLLLEFQSTIDEHMALRMMVYLGLLYQDLIKQEVIQAGECLPPVFPIVIYNGNKPWDAPQSMRELIVPVPKALRNYLPDLRYFVLDEGRAGPVIPENTLSAIIELETVPNPEQLSRILGRVQKLLAASEHQSLRRAILSWMCRVVLQRMVPEEPFLEVQKLEELESMLAENVTKWSERLKQKGMQEGRQEGHREGLYEGLQKGASALLQCGMSAAEIAAALKLNEAEVRKLLKVG